MTLVMRFWLGLPALKIQTNFMGDVQGGREQKTYNIRFFNLK